jgi:probable HAF family extracellular repeat protein
MRKLFSIVFSAVLLLIGSAQGTWAQKVKVYELGHYPGGTWAEPTEINNSGVVVGYGDIPSGFTRPIGVPLFGPQARQWFDLGTLGGEQTDSEVMCMGIADTGMIVGHAAITGGEIVHAFAWTPKSGMVDIGTLGDIGYSGYTFSIAFNVNKAGTLIVGWSNTGWGGGNMLPVVWTPKVVWTSGRPTTTWSIQKLDTGGFSFPMDAVNVNDFGEIIGLAFNPDGAWIPVLWNPVPGGKGWKIMQLPVSSDYPNAGAADINDKGEIAGFVASPDWGTALPALWRKKSPWGTIWNLTVLAAPSGSPWSEAHGINERGDIVGGTYDANWNLLAARWSTKDPNFVQLLGFPGTWSYAFSVNDNSIAAGAYGSDTILENVAAVQFGPE